MRKVEKNVQKYLKIIQVGPVYLFVLKNQHEGEKNYTREIKHKSSWEVEKINGYCT